jgi:hypothetical protein
MDDVRDKSPRSIALLATAAITAVVTLLLAGRLTPALESFRGILEGLGAPTPPMTTMVLDATYLWWSLAAAAGALFVWVAAKPRLTAGERKYMKQALTVLIAAVVFAYAFAAYWLYLPLYTLGTTV